VALPGPRVHHRERAGARAGGRRGNWRPLQPCRRLPGAGAEVGGEHGEAAASRVGAIHGAGSRRGGGRSDAWDVGGGEEQGKRLLGRFGLAQLEAYGVRPLLESWEGETRACRLITIQLDGASTSLLFLEEVVGFYFSCELLLLYCHRLTFIYIYMFNHLSCLIFLKIFNLYLFNYFYY
jgi:hypothetical protein